MESGEHGVGERRGERYGGVRRVVVRGEESDGEGRGEFSGGVRRGLGSGGERGGVGGMRRGVESAEQSGLEG